MSEENKTIKLYPSNWLYNAGVVGFLSALENSGFDLDNILKSDGSASINFNDFKLEANIKDKEKSLSKIGLQWLLDSWSIVTKREETEDSEKIKKAWGSLFNVHYRGLFNANNNYFYKPSKSSPAIIDQFNSFLKSFSVESENSINCSFCNTKSNRTLNKNYFTSEHSKIIGPTAGEKGLPNAFWNMNKETGLEICDFCSFILISNHLAITKLGDNSEIFVNTPSLQTMYELNKLIKETFNIYDKTESRTKRGILATSIIEYSRRIQSTMGLWSRMNIELVIKRIDQIEFYSIPHEVVNIISDRKIATILSELGEFNILNKLLDGKFHELNEIGYRLLKESTKEFNKRDKNTINDLLYKNENKRRLTNTANKIFKLIALINDKIKETNYG